VHGDNPQAVTFVRKLRERLEQEEVLIAAPERLPDFE
jgi:lactam utilization protein B